MESLRRSLIKRSNVTATDFPADFMFQLTMDEAREWWLAVNPNRLRSQTVTLKREASI